MLQIPCLSRNLAANRRAALPPSGNKARKARLALRRIAL
jgi:hypothetical protein